MELKCLIESLLFVADGPVDTKDLAAAIEITEAEVSDALQALDVDCQARGIRLQRRGTAVQLVSAPEAGPQIERFLGRELSGRLSTAAMETVTIVAYQQPVTRTRVEAIRGVRSDGVLRSLVRHGLIEQVGRAETVGRPILFGTTFEFLQQFGLRSLSELPDWETLGEGHEQRGDSVSAGSETQQSFELGSTEDRREDKP